VTLDDLEWRIQGLPKVFFKVPAIISGTGKATDFKLGRYIHRVHPNKSPLKFLEKRECGRIHYPWTAQSFKVPPIISGTGKATDFKFGWCIDRVHPNKSSLKMLEKRERGRNQGLPSVLKYPLLSQTQVKLRTSNLAGTFTGSIRTEAH